MRSGLAAGFIPPGVAPPARRPGRRRVSPRAFRPAHREVGLLGGLRQHAIDAELCGALGRDQRRGRGEQQDAELATVVVLAHALGELQAVHAGHHHVEHDDEQRHVVGCARSSAASPALPLSTEGGRIPQLISISSRMRRFVALSSTTSTRRPPSGRRDSGGEAGRWCRCSAEARGEVEGAAAPGSLSSQMRPPIMPRAARDGQAEPGAAVLARGRAVDLRERLEDAAVPRRDAGAGVAHATCSSTSSSLAGSTATSPRPRRAR
jgi:hypothetical protein